MKRLVFAFVFLMLNSFLFPQSDVMRFLSLGFNVEEFSVVGRSGKNMDYFFFGFEDYSEAFIYGTTLFLNVGDGLYYSSGYIRSCLPPTQYSFFYDSNNTIGLYWDSPGFGELGQIQRFENGKLIYYALTYGRRNTASSILENIDQDAQRIIIRIRSVEDPEILMQSIFYNIPANELLDLFYRAYIELIRSVIDGVNEYSGVDEISNEVSLLLQGRTARELAIFRNSLFAIKGLRFQTQSWVDFFNRHLIGYNGQYTNTEVMAMFTDNEQWLLNLILQYENR